MSHAATTHSAATGNPPGRHQQQRAHSVTAMPSELQKSVQRHQEAEHQEKLRHNQPWWQYYYQLYHYHLPPGRKPTVFGPYLLLQTLGEGEFGKVKFGIEVKTGQEVAIKLIRKDSMDSTSRMTKVEREISVLRILHHPNIVELFDVIETEKYIGIILQCATGGELFDYILAHRYLKERDASRLFAQLISGVHYMHQKHIVHRDLKLENLLLDRHRNVLITDFGFANQFSSSQDDLMSTSCGSPCYAAPELVMNQGVYVGPAVDIWSCGVILFAMLCGYLPYDDDPANPESYNINLLYKYILNTPLIFPDYISDEACELLSLMLVPDPEKRCTMDTIMSHSWLSPHQHLFTTPEEQVLPDTHSSRNSTPVSQKPTEGGQDEAVVMEEDEAVVPQLSTPLKEEIEEKIPLFEEEAHVSEEETHVKEADTPMPDITITPTESPLTNGDTPMSDNDNDTVPDIQAPPSPAPSSPPPPTPITTPAEDEVAPLPTPSPASPPATTVATAAAAAPSPPVVRPKSTSTEKVLHFLSGHNTTPKQRVTTNRTRHMSLAPVTEGTSILQQKFLSSVSTTDPQKNTGVVPNTSASTPHKKNVRLSVNPPVTRGTRKKTLSLLVNSMTDNTKMSSRRQSTMTPPNPEMMPSVSEQTVSDKEKHRSAGKKLMDWFKKKPQSTVNRSSNASGEHGCPVPPLPPSSTTTTASETCMDDIKLRTHHGAVDGEALTSRPPAQIFQQVKQTLKSLGLEFKRDGGEFKLKCARPKKPVKKIQPPPFRMLLRRPSATNTTNPATPNESVATTIYGDPNVDPGDEVRFSVELCKIKNLPGLYIVDMRRMRGNVWAYKFIYRTLLDTLNLGGKSGYLNTSGLVMTAEEETQPDKTLSNHRMSTASSGAGSSSVLLDDSTLAAKQSDTIKHDTSHGEEITV
ncbi:hypothetical protein INT47_005793 [Mucor saturninus]|uniref:non-specific serine/threonine protein kinase n=1 Tax=Mucor saturninus TaxID=64648 RepID=A0A8H7QMU8_9FUNG|nr:hypothetical protein INT47_005793 [Mucor saturninus]